MKMDLWAVMADLQSRLVVVLSLGKKNFILE